MAGWWAQRSLRAHTIHNMFHFGRDLHLNQSGTCLTR